MKIKSAASILLCLSLCGCSANGAAPTDPDLTEIVTVTNSEGETITSVIDHSSENREGSSNIYLGELSELADKYEGTAGTGDFNYGEALQKSLIFYELQRSGKLSGNERTNWRGDSALNDGADNGVDLTGGLFDAGDNVKFNLPMAYTSSMLAWSVYEDLDSYEKSGQLQYALDTIRWVNDYLIKCHTAEYEYYYQVGDGNADHAWWGPAEVMQMNRPSYKVTKDSPGSTVVGEAAASLAACSVVFKDIDGEYSQKCLTHAIQLYKFAEETKSDSGYTAANGFYNSWSGFNDELSWAADWLYIATGEREYLEKAKTYFAAAETDYKWSMCWDDKGIGSALLLTKLTGESAYTSFVEKTLDFWTATGSEKITVSPKGLAWLDQWGSLRYSTTMAFIAACYSESEACPDGKRDIYWDFAVKQVNYALGSTGRSFVCGFGENYPVNPHHRTAQGSYCDNKNIPSPARHTLYGALVGGPDASDNYEDNVEDYNKNEVACDYNAGYTCALAKLYSRYGGQTLVDFGAVEPVENEYEVEACVNAAGENFTEIKAIVYNKTAWPARVSDNLKLRYFVDLSECDPLGISISVNYSKDGAGCTLVPWDEEKSIYCAEVDFGNTLIYPGGQDAYRSEVQFRMTSSGAWDPDNDYSYSGLGTAQGTASLVTTLALYDGDKLVWGSQPDGEAGASVTGGGNAAQSPAVTATAAPTVNAVNAGSASEGGLTVNLSGTGAQSNAVTLNLEIVNNSGSDIDLGSMEVLYFFTSDGENYVYDNYYSAVEGGSYQALSGVSGQISEKSGTDCDRALKITCSSGTLPSGGKWVINGSLHTDSWSNINSANDFSNNNAGNIAVYSGGKLVCGKEP
ncbi:MAG: glycoside hydrolase family 9 protein [Firmicutes bacterium]|nr:glycoside hydrolase family 9 protein [[Eubacterium] siraeum]MCM1487698.1 glycoside hydrolase family 9 protein [Bacillota bacterium]